MFILLLLQGCYNIKEIGKQLLTHTRYNVLFIRKFYFRKNKKANQIYERHLYITKFLQKTLGISEELAARDACRIEHIISQETFERIKENVDS